MLGRKWKADRWLMVEGMMTAISTIPPVLFGIMQFIAIAYEPFCKCNMRKDVSPWTAQRGRQYPYRASMKPLLRAVLQY